jgi:Fur family peroxide stress response transcriptional regulator
MSACDPHPSPIAARLTRRCRDAGLKVTPQRLAVYEAVVASTAHPSPEEVYRLVRQGMPTMSLGTVYKNLDCLEGIGLVVRVASASSTRRYDGRLDDHHHLVCTGCGRIEDYTDPGIESLQPSGKLAGFAPHKVSVQVLGTCAPCARRES